MSEQPRILIVEDSATDADLASREIRKGLGACVFEVVETREAFLAALDIFRPDLVVSDYTLPRFDGLQALQLSLRHDPLLPVILVTGSLNEETAVHCIKSGATDYVLKDRITRLPFAVKEALAQKQTRLAKEAAEQALRESERFAHSTVDALSAHLAILDDSGEIIAVNRAWREFAAANSSTPATVREGANYLTICDTARGPDSTEAADMAAGIRAVMRGERTEFTLEYPCHAPDEQRWFVARVTRFAGEGAVRVVVAHENITERKRTEEALRESEEKYRAFFQSSLDAILLTTPDGGIQAANPAACKMLGRTEAEICALGRGGLVDTSDPRLAVLLNERARTGSVFGELTMFRNDGSPFPIEMSSSLFRDKQGNLRTSLMVRDITERRRAEEALRESEERNRLLLEHAPIGIAVHSNGKIVFTNPAGARLLGGESAEEIMGRPISDIIHPDGLNAARDRIQRMLAGETGLYPVEDVYVRLDGSSVPVEVMATALTYQGQAAVQVMILDITGRKRAEEVLRSQIVTLQALTEIGQAITSSLDLDRVLQTLLDKVRDAAGAEACSVALIEPASGDLVFRQAVGSAPESVIGLRLSPGQGLAGWAAQQRQTVMASDVSADPRAYLLRDRGDFITRELIAVPLIVRDVVTGVIELVNKRRGRFSEDDRRLLESVAAQASIAIENARLFETEHAAREALETLYRVGQAVNSTLDADAILDRLTDEAMRITQATHGSALVARPDRGCFERRSLRGYSPEQADKARADWLPLDRGVNGRAYSTRQVVYVEDVQLDPDYHPLISETHSELAVPILRGDRVIGNLDLQSPQVAAFRTVRLDFLQALTDQVAIALENARLFAETRRQMEELSIVSQVALVGAAGQPFDETVARATDALSRLWPGATLGFLTLDVTGLLLHLDHIQPSPALLPQTISIPIDQGITGWAVREQQPIRTGDVTTDPRYLAIIPDIRSLMVAPVVVGQRVIGAVDVGSPAVDAFSDDDLRILTTLAGQLATIFEKARLDAELAGYAAQLERRVEERTVEIRRAQARTQAILDALGEGVVVTDVQGTIQYMNPAMEQVTGYSAGECIGQNPRLWKSGQTPLAVYQAMWAAILAGHTWRGEIANRRKDGEIYFASLAAAPIPTVDNDTGQLAGLVGVQRDITERKRAEEEMRRALEKERELNTLKSNFVSLTSHEFRTPLTTILSSAEMLEYYSDRLTAEKKLGHLRRIQTAVKLMTSLLDDILIIGKAEAGKLEFVPAPLDLVKFCRDLVEELQLTDKANHLLMFEGEVDCGQGLMDQRLLQHILSNLLSNALKYSPQGSTVQFTLHCQAGQAVFQIQDHGLGIPLEDQARLFETFHRASNVRNIQGTGLGLAIVKRSVDLHGGTIDVASQVGVGTTFTVTLPLDSPRVP